MTVEVVRAGSGKPKALSVNCIGALALSGRLTSAKVSFVEVELKLPSVCLGSI